MQIGSTIRFANMIQGRNILERDQIYALGTILSMNQITTDSSIEILEKLAIIDIEKDKTGQITSIDERIPETFQFLSDIGKILVEPDVEEVRNFVFNEKEDTVLQILEICSEKIYERNALLSDLNLNEDLFKTTLELGHLGGLLVETETNDGFTVICNPGLYFNKYPLIEKTLNQSSLDEANLISSIMEKITRFPGYPLNRLEKEEQKVTLNCIKEGFILPSHTDPEFVSTNNNSTFLFPPLPVFKDATPQGDIFEKSKTMITSLRHAQFLGKPTRLVRPDLLISKLLKGREINFHSSSKTQYMSSAIAGIVQLDQGIGYTLSRSQAFEGYRPVLIQTKENVSAVELADNLMKNAEISIEEILKSDKFQSDDILSTPSYHMSTIEYRGSFRYSPKDDKKLKNSFDELRFKASGGIKL